MQTERIVARPPLPPPILPTNFHTVENTVASEKRVHTSANQPELGGADRITVHLGNRSYDIVIFENAVKGFGKLLRERGISGEVMIFTSPRIGDLYFEMVQQSLRSAGFTRIVRHDIPDGEKNKNWKEYSNCLDALMKHFPESGEIPIVINLGGGVVGDIGGFAAGTFRRGIPYIQVPTTLLGDVDCGVGGKVGINFNHVKNIIGMFHQPLMVFSDLSFLKTLDPREVRSGVAEVIKYGAVCSRELFEYLEDNIEKLVALEPAVLRNVVNRCYRIKAEVVEQDEEDNKGVRIVLNFGHTVGHALEMEAKYRMTHGEAISVGMIAATKIALRLNKCDQTVLDRLQALINRAGLPVSIPPKQKINITSLLETMKHDKKAVEGTNRFVLPTAIGKWCKHDKVSESLIAEVVKTCFA